MMLGVETHPLNAAATATAIEVLETVKSARIQFPPYYMRFSFTNWVDERVE